MGGFERSFKGLSRVQTMAGLYLAAPLSENLSKYAMSTKMKNMIKGFQTRIGLQLYTQDQYDNMLSK
jgi:hypothetical protein